MEIGNFFFHRCLLNWNTFLGIEYIYIKKEKKCSLWRRLKGNPLHLVLFVFNDDTLTWTYELIRGNEDKGNRIYKSTPVITSLLCVQNIWNGLSGEFLTIQVKLMVEPIDINISGPPKMVVNGSKNIIKIEGKILLNNGVSSCLHLLPQDFIYLSSEKEI